MYKFILFLPLVLTLYLTSSQANAGPSVDVTTLDIAGVKIGMSADEAIAALIDTYGVNVADIEVTMVDDSDVGNKIVQRITLLSPDAETGYTGVSTISKGWKVDVGFVPVVPFNGESVQATSITYEIARTSDNRKALAQAATEKYGEPSSQKPGGLQLTWCENPPKGYGSCDADAYLQIQGTKMVLIDSRINNQVGKARQAAKSVKPKI